MEGAININWKYLKERNEEEFGT